MSLTDVIELLTVMNATMTKLFQIVLTEQI